VVPPGSRQALSDDKPVSQTFGENTLGEVAEGPLLRLPALSEVFSRRAARLRELSSGHELEAFLRLVAALVDAQNAALDKLPAGSLPKLSGKAPLDPVTFKRDATWREALKRLLETIDSAALPDAAQEARNGLQKASAETLEGLADRFIGGDVAAKEAAQTVFIAAALQVAWTRMAALLDPSDVGSVDSDSGLCPVCASPSVAGVVTPGGTKFGHRHLCCSLCNTSWRYVRVRCVHCSSTDKISYRQLAGTTYLRCECCENCHGYSKLFYLEKAKPVEPLADDLASLGLDVLVGEEGFSRVPNPFVLGVMQRQEG
jgi:FdhE protein